MHAAPTWAHMLEINKTAAKRINRIYALGARLTLGLLWTTADDTAIALAGFTPPTLEAKARLLRLKKTLDQLQIQSSHQNLPTTHYSPSDHLQYTLRLITRPLGTTRSTRLRNRKLPPPPLPTSKQERRWMINSYILYETDREWNKSEHGRTLHNLRYTPVRWRHWYKKMERTAVVPLSQFLSDHFPCAQYLHRFKLATTEECRFCRRTETTMHLLYECTAFEAQRIPLAHLFKNITPDKTDFSTTIELEEIIRKIHAALRNTDPIDTA